MKIINAVIKYALMSEIDEKNKGSEEKINDYNGRDYRTVWQHPRAKMEDVFETGLIKKLLTKNDGWFLDIGAGYGRLYPLFKKQNRKVVLLDYAMNLLEMAEKENKNNPEIYFVAADAYHLPFKENVFKGGISVRVFHHMNIPEKFMGEIGRVCLLNAEIVMEYANKRNLFRIFRRGGKALKKDHEEYEPLHFGTHPAYFKKVAVETGFKIEKTFGTGFFPRFLKEKTVFLLPPLSFLETIFDITFGKIGLAPLHFAKIKKVEGETNTPLKKIEDILCCPRCRGELDFSKENLITCKKCSGSFPKKGQIFDFRN